MLLTRIGPRAAEGHKKDTIGKLQSRKSLSARVFWPKNKKITVIAAEREKTPQQMSQAKWEDPWVHVSNRSSTATSASTLITDLHTSPAAKK